MLMKKSSEIGRDVIDEVVLSNVHRNPEMFESVKDIPSYQYGVKVEDMKFKFDTAAKKGNIKCSMIQDIINTVRVMEMEKEDAYIVRVDENGESTNIPVHEVLVKLVKVCIATSISIDESFSEVVSTFAKHIVENAENLILPITLPKGNKLQEIVGEELNKYLRELCDENKIHYSECVETPKKKSPKQSKSKLLQAAKLAGGLDA